MSSLVSKTVILVFAVSLFARSERFGFSNSHNEPIVQVVDQLCEQLKQSKNPESVFQLSTSKLSPNIVYAKWLDPSQFVSEDSKSETKEFHGSLAYARIKAPFFRVAQTIIAHDGEAKFIPGIKATKVLTRKRETRDKEYVLMEREREVPVALKPFILSGSKYKVENMIYRKEGDWILVRVKLASGSSEAEKSMMKSIEGFEFAKDIGNGEVFIMSGGFALPNLGFLKLGKSKNESSKTSLLKAPISKATLGFLDKVTEKLDFRTQLQTLISDSIVEGTFQSVAAIVQVTTDQRWKAKWAYQLSKEETKALFNDNKQLLEKAKKNSQISYQVQ